MRWLESGIKERCEDSMWSLRPSLEHDLLLQDTVLRNLVRLLEDH